MDDLIELARKHGVLVIDGDLEGFAAAIRAQERERCAALADTFRAPIYVQATADENGPEAEALTEIMRHELYGPLAAAIRSME